MSQHRHLWQILQFVRLANKHFFGKVTAAEQRRRRVSVYEKQMQSPESGSDCMTDKYWTIQRCFYEY